MGGGLRLDDERISLEANSLAGAAGYFNAKTLGSADTRSTITANGSSKNAFRSAQDNIASFGGALDKEAENIRSLNLAFKEFDAMMGMLARGGNLPSGKK